MRQRRGQLRWQHLPGWERPPFRSPSPLVGGRPRTSFHPDLRHGPEPMADPPAASPPSARRRRGPSLGGRPCLPCTGCTAATGATPQRGRRPSHPTTVVRLYCDPKRQLDVGFRPPERAATLACLSGDVGARSARRGWAGLGLSPASGGRRRRGAEESPAMQAADRRGGRGGDAAGAQYSDRRTHRLALRKSYVCT